MKKLLNIYLAIILALSLGITILPSQPAKAAGDFNVPSDYSTIQAAMDDAETAGGGTVHVADGTYYERITLKSGVKVIADNIGGAVIDAGGAGAVVTALNVDSTAEISGLVITGGANLYSDPDAAFSDSGGMYNVNSSPSITNCTFTENSGCYSGGIHNENSSPAITGCVFDNNTCPIMRGGGINNENNSNPLITNCTFTGNSAQIGGGGMYNDNSSPTIIGCEFTNNTANNPGGGIGNMNNSNPLITNCTFTGNSAGWGGGIYNGLSSPNIIDCIFTNNEAGIGGGMYNAQSSPAVTDCTFDTNLATSVSANRGGGGIYNLDYSSPTVTGCSFTNNSADWSGGGMNNTNYCSPIVTDCIFNGNAVAGHGGGMFNYGHSSPNVTGCIFTNNMAIGGTTVGGLGGGLYMNGYSSPTITNCIFNGNSAQSYGGGICINGESCSTNIVNCTIYGNSAFYGGGIYTTGLSTGNVANCILWADESTGLNAIDEIFDSNSFLTVNYCDVAGEDIYTGTGNINADPLFVDAAGGDFHLTDGSPCVNAGDNSAIPAGITEDFEGDPRISFGTVDMGADEIPNIPPVAVDDNAATNEDTSVTIYVRNNDTDADGGTIIITSATQPANGVVTYDMSDITYTPNLNYNGTDSFTYSIGDFQGGTDTATVTIKVTPVNDPPVISAYDPPTPVTMNEGGSRAFAVTASDVDGDVLTYSWTKDGSPTGTNSASYQFQPGYTAAGTYTIKCQVSDDLVSVSQEWKVIVNDINRPPEIETITGSEVNDGETSTLSFSFADPDYGDTHSATINWGDGKSDLIDPAESPVSALHSYAATGSYTVSVQVTDADGAYDTGTATCTVIHVNTPPVAADDTASTGEDTPVIIDVLANDSDIDGDNLTVDSVTQPASGTAVVNPDDTVTYTPVADWNGIDSFSYTVSDGNGGTDTATVEVTVNPVNDSPVAVDDAATVVEGGTVTMLDSGADSVLANDSDADDEGDTLTVSEVTGPSHGTLTLNSDGTFSYTHDGSETTSDSFTYQVSDDDVPIPGSDQANVTINIIAVNDAPVAHAGDDTTYTLGVSQSTIDVTLDGSASTDIDGTIVTYTWTGTPDPDDVVGPMVALGAGVRTFTLVVTDDDDATSDPDTVTITVEEAPNEPPVADDDSYSVDEGGTLTVSVPGVLENDSDVENETLSAVLVTDVSNGTLTLNPDGSFDYTHDGSRTTSDSFTYKANDGTNDSNIATVSITINPVVIEVTIDIKPGSDPNSINLKSKGVVPVAVLTTNDFDASEVDPESVEFAGAEPERWTSEDVDGDGDLDLLFHFRTQELDLTKDSEDATLTGQTTDGHEITGTDSVRIVPQKGKK